MAGYQRYDAAWDDLVRRGEGGGNREVIWTYRNEGGWGRVSGIRTGRWACLFVFLSGSRSHRTLHHLPTEDRRRSVS